MSYRYNHSLISFNFIYYTSSVCGVIMYSRDNSMMTDELNSLRVTRTRFKWVFKKISWYLTSYSRKQQPHTKDSQIFIRNASVSAAPVILGQTIQLNKKNAKLAKPRACTQKKCWEQTSDEICQRSAMNWTITVSTTWNTAANTFSRWCMFSLATDMYCRQPTG